MIEWSNLLRWWSTPFNNYYFTNVDENLSDVTPQQMFMDEVVF